MGYPLEVSHTRELPETSLENTDSRSLGMGWDLFWTELYFPKKDMLKS